MIDDSEHNFTTPSVDQNYHNQYYHSGYGYTDS